ncbi:glycosyltransferase 87 family protein [Corynebacterium callunae]|uniref:glycosyltransferase 87 family protein n=1 Tax=Corynebacterium callunae TaxID=1721 RepID=UPI00398285D8
MNKQTFYWVSTSLVLMGALGTILLGWPLAWRAPIDLEVYWQGAQEFWTGSNLYELRFPTRTTTLPFTYPPFAAIIFTPVWWLVDLVGLTISSLIFTLLSLLMLFYISKLLLSIAGIHSRLWIFVGGVAMCLTVPVHSTLNIGQINIALMTLTLIDVTRSGHFDKPTGWIRWVPLGLLTGIAAAIKLTPLVFGLYFLMLWIMGKSPRGLLGMLGGFFGATALAFIVQPATSLQYFTQVLFATDRIGDQSYAKNVSFRGMIERFPELGSAASLVWVLTVFVVLVLIEVALFRILSRGFTPRTTILAVSVVSLAAVLCSPVSWYHHWVWLVPLVAALWINGFHKLALWGVFAQTVGSFHMYLPAKNGAELSWNPFMHILATHYLWYSLAVIIVLIIKEVPAPKEVSR